MDPATHFQVDVAGSGSVEYVCVCNTCFPYLKCLCGRFVGVLLGELKLAFSALVRVSCFHSESGKRESGNLSTLSTIWGKGLFKVSWVIEKKLLSPFWRRLLKCLLPFVRL